MTRYLFTTMLIGGMLFGGMLFAGTVQGDIILFQDDFDGQAGVPLDGTTPDVTQGTTTWATSLWTGGETPVPGDGYEANGTVKGTKRNAYLTLGNLIDDNRGNPDAIYTLSATLDVDFDSGSTSWEAIGFWNVDNPVEKQFTTGPKNGVAWMLRRQNAELRVFRGPGTDNGLTSSAASPNNVAGEVDLQVVLDLTTWNGSSDYGNVTYYAKLSTDATYTEVASGALGSSNSSFRSVGLSGGIADAQVSFFELSQVPEPATMTMLVFGGLMALLRRRRR